jgi:hypothetical protein
VGLKGRYFGVFLERYKRMVYGQKDTAMNYTRHLMNQTLLIILKQKDIAWAGHLVRMKDDRTLQKIFNTKPDGVRCVGRPKLPWEDGVDQDMKMLGIKYWKIALNRDEWAQLLKKARAYHGLSSE